MTRFEVGFTCDGDCEKCGSSCPGEREVFSPDEYGSQEGEEFYADLGDYDD